MKWNIQGNKNWPPLIKSPQMQNQCYDERDLQDSKYLWRTNGRAWHYGPSSNDQQGHQRSNLLKHPFSTSIAPRQFTAYTQVFPLHFTLLKYTKIYDPITNTNKTNNFTISPSLLLIILPTPKTFFLQVSKSKTK